MKPSPLHALVERQFRALLSAGELPPPDRVEYEETTVAFWWDGPKVVGIVDLDDDAALDEHDLAELGVGELLH